MIEQKIHRLIAEYKIEQVFEYLFGLIRKLNYDNTHKRNKDSLIILSARYYDLMHQKVTGIISNDAAVLESNKILNGILQIYNWVENSSEYKKKKSEINEIENEFDLLVDTSNCEVSEELKYWGKFNTNRTFENINIEIGLNDLSWTIHSEFNELVGANRFLNFIKGKITYEYCPIKFNDVNDNLLFFVIPMKSNENLIEVGSNVREDPNNGYSPFRIRKLANPILNQWQKGEINFDFSNTPEANCSVFAFRINEGSPRAEKGIMKVKNIKIYKVF